MKFKGFGEEKELIDWLDHDTIHEEVTADVIRKRMGRGPKWNLPRALSEPVVKIIPKERADRKKKKKNKIAYRRKMFGLAREVREAYSKGESVPAIAEKFDLKKSMAYRMVCRYEWYNKHWKGDFDTYDIRRVTRSSSDEGDD